jgi:molybdate transport system permease protein
MPVSRRQTPVGGPGPRLFAGLLLGCVGLVVAGLLALIVADVAYVRPGALREVLVSREIRASLWLTTWTSLVTVVLGLLVSIPVGYALSRYRFPGHALVDSFIELPIILPPLVLGLSLLVFFQTAVGRAIEATGLSFVYQPLGIVLCQLLLSVSFGVRALKLAFDEIDPRLEHVAMTLGCGRAGAFWHVALPLARRGIVTGGILVWARAFGIFGPLMIFVGSVRMRTEVLSTTIYLEQSIGRDEVALAVALLMLALATVALVVIRVLARRYDPC